MVVLFIILFIAGAIIADIIIQARRAGKNAPDTARAHGLAAVPEQVVLRMPMGIFFHPGHSWARLQSGDRLEVGVDDFVLKAVGTIERIEVPEPGTSIRQGEPMVTIHQADHQLSIVSPLSGKVTQIHTDILNNPSLLNESPYAEGWLCVVEPENLARSLSFLSIAEEAVRWIKGEVVRLREFIIGEMKQPLPVGATMTDGGVPVINALSHLGEGSWKKFEHAFLRTP